MDLIWKSILLISSGVIFLRISGRKSISQMTISQTVIMISIGTLIVQPIADRSIWRAILAIAIFTASNILMEYFQVKFNFLERLLTGNAKIVIQEGEVISKNLKKLKITTDQLEMRLRQQGIKKISDVKTATIEPNGQLGYELIEDAQPLTVGEFKKMMGSLIVNQNQSTGQTDNIFREVTKKEHIKNIPDQLH